MSISLAPTSVAARQEGGRSLWGRFIEFVREDRAGKTSHCIAEYLDKHMHELPPEIRIELERRLRR